MRKIALLLLVIIVIALAVIKNDNTVKSEKPVIKIGVSLPMTGNNARIGYAARKAVEMAIDELNADEEKKFIYEAVIENDSEGPSRAVLNYHRMKDIQKIKAFITFGSANSQPIVFLANRDEIVHFSITKSLRATDGGFNFTNWCQTKTMVNKTLQEFKKRDIKRVAVIAINSPAGEEEIKVFKKEGDKYGVEVVFHDVINTGDRDFAIILNKLKYKRPEILVIDLINPELDILRKQMIEMGIDIPITSLGAVTVSENLSLFNSNWFVEVSTGSEQWQANFKSKYGDILNLGTVNFYDSIKIISEAYENVGIGSQKEVAKYMQDMEFIGGSGKVSSNSVGVFESEPLIKIIKNGKVEILEEK